MCTVSAKNCLQNMTAKPFPLAPRDNNQPSKTCSAGAGREVGEHLKYTATLPLYITLESAVLWTNFPCFCYLNFLKFKFLNFNALVLVKTFPMMYQLPMYD